MRKKRNNQYKKKMIDKLKKSIHSKERQIQREVSDLDLLKVLSHGEFTGQEGSIISISYEGTIIKFCHENQIIITVIRSHDKVDCLKIKDIFPTRPTLRERPTVEKKTKKENDKKVINNFSGEMNYEEYCEYLKQ